MSCACVIWFVRECARVREGMPPSLHFRTAPGRCVSLFTILPVVESMRVDVRAVVRASCVHCSPWGGLRRARAVLRASRVMREAVHARVRRSASFAPCPYRV